MKEREREKGKGVSAGVGEISPASDFYGETLRLAHAKVDAVWAVVEFMNTRLRLNGGRRRSQLEGICGSLGVDHGPKLLLLCIM